MWNWIRFGCILCAHFLAWVQYLDEWGMWDYEPQWRKAPNEYKKRNKFTAVRFRADYPSKCRTTMEYICMKLAWKILFIGWLREQSRVTNWGALNWIYMNCKVYGHRLGSGQVHHCHFEICAQMSSHLSTTLPLIMTTSTVHETVDPQNTGKWIEYPVSTCLWLLWSWLELWYTISSWLLLWNEF